MSTNLSIACVSIPIRASSSSRSGAYSKKPNSVKPVSSSWWAPLFGISSDPDYINTENKNNSVVSDKQDQPSRSRFVLGSFTEEKAKELRRKTVEGSSFHDIMYHSAIASRLAIDVSEK